MNRVVKDSPLGLRPLKPNNATREVRGANRSLSARSQRAPLRAEPTGLSPRGANDLCVRGEDMHGSAQVREEDWCLSAQVREEDWCPSAQVRGEDKHWSAQVWRRIHVNMYV